MPNAVYSHCPEPFAPRFWSKVDKNGPILRPDLGPCWVWTRCRRPTGYGISSMNGRHRDAHVVAYILTVGHEPPPETPIITHLCDGAAVGCVRPPHLKADTQAGNLRGMVERGRALIGMRNPMARMTDDLVRTIRRRKAEGATYDTLALEFGLTRTPLWKIVHRITWTHVT